MGAGEGRPEWWRWGDGTAALSAARTDRVLTYLQKELGLTRFERVPAAVPIRAPSSRLRPAEIGGLGFVRMEDDIRVSHSFGRSYVDVLSARRGDAKWVTDAVAYPASVEEVRKVLDLAMQQDLAVIPWGGGTSVVGGVTPETDNHRGVVTLSLERMNRTLKISPRDQLGSFECGVFGPDLEQRLQAQGLTLGHFPQSFEFSTLGGWIATRSSGQASSLYGDISHRVMGLTVQTPGGEVRWERPIEEATGPSVDSLFIGSEGTLGILTDATLSLSARPESATYHALLLKDWKDALVFLQEVAAGPVVPAVIRLSDPAETRLTLAGREAPLGLKRVLERTYLGYHGVAQGETCLGILGFEGDRSAVDAGWKRAASLLARAGGIDVGRGAGESWRKERFSLPYLRDLLMDHGLFVETLETGTAWSTLQGLYDALHSRLQEAARSLRLPLFIGTHVSHATSHGACLYLTLITQQSPEGVDEPFTTLKRAAMGAITSHHGSLSHHHGIGSMHRLWVSPLWEGVARDVLWSMKSKLDPKGLLNPGKTLPLRPQP